MAYGPGGSLNQQQRWLSEILYPKPCVDASVALILSLAKNIESIKISPSVESSLCMTLNALSLPWIRLAVSTDDDKSIPKKTLENTKREEQDQLSLELDDQARRRTIGNHTHLVSFSKLHHLCIYVNGYQARNDIFITPYMKTLRIKYGFWNLRFPTLHEGATSMTIIELKGIRLDEQVLIHGLTSGYLENLTRFILKNVDVYRQLNINPLVDAMVANLPKLKHLEWTTRKYSRQLPLRNLTRFTSMKTLKTDLGMVVSPGSFMQLESPETLLPLNLHTLHLVSIPLHGFHKELTDLSERGQTKTTNIFKRLASSFPLRELFLRVEAIYDDESDVEPGVVPSIAAMLQEATKTASAIGTHFQVLINPSTHGDDDDQILLVSAGIFTVRKCKQTTECKRTI